LRLVFKEFLSTDPEISLPEMLFRHTLTLVGVKGLVGISRAIFDMMPGDFTSVANIARWKWDIGSH
jgi:hypothetical protein